MVAVADAPDDLTGAAAPPGRTSRGLVVAAAAGLACLGLAVLLWPGADLHARIEQTRQQARADRELLGTLQAQRDEALAAARASQQAARAAREEADSLDARRAGLAETQEAVRRAEAEVLGRLQAVVAATDAVVTAQNEAVARSNQGDQAAEEQILRSRAIPAVEQLRAAVAAVQPTLQPLRADTAELGGQLP